MHPLKRLWAGVVLAALTPWTGRPTPLLEIERGDSGAYRLLWAADESGYVLEESPTVNDPSGWLPVPTAPQRDGLSWVVPIEPAVQQRFYRLSGLSLELTKVTETSPAQGEFGVSVNRETVFRFSAPLASDTVLTPQIFSAQAAGRVPLTRVELAPDRRSATLFYLEPLPSGTRMTVELNGFAVLDAAGRALDADGDGIPGGIASVEFVTAHAVAVGQTAVIGRVLDSTPNADGSERPLSGVTITVDGTEQTLRAVTDAGGHFVLSPSPAGRFFVHVDGRTSPMGQWPLGAYYPFIGKAWDAVAGRTNNPANGTGVIYLPRVPSDALQVVSATETTVVTLSPTVLEAEPALAGVEIRIPPNALYANDGSRGGRVGLAPVPPDRLPEPLPPGLMLPLVITIQTDGPGNFDRPVPVRLPNLPDPSTGVRLPPGAKTALWSFDHDQGRWEVAGPMTITADGRFAETDAGVGVRQPGWHGAAPGSGGCGTDCPCVTCTEDPPSDPPKEEECNPFNPFCEGNKCIKDARLLANSLSDLIEDIGATIGDDGAPGCALGIGNSAIRAARDCSIDINACGQIEVANPIIDGAIGSALGCIPKAGGILGTTWTFKSVLININNVIDCANKPQARVGRNAGAGAALGTAAGFNDFVDRIQSLLNRQLEVCEASSNLVAQWYGPKWATAITPTDATVYRSLMLAVESALESGSEQGMVVTAAERTAILSLPRPESISAGDVDALFARFERFRSGGFHAGNPEADAFIAAVTRYEQVVDARQTEGWTTLFDGIYRAAALLSALTEPAAGSVAYGGWSGSTGGAVQSQVGRHAIAPEPAFPRRAHHYVLVDLLSGFSRRGRLSTDGRFPPLVLGATRPYTILYLDPETGLTGASLFYSQPAGRQSRIPAAPLLRLNTGAADADADGLSDTAELILGTDPRVADSDGDGLADGAEFLAQSNPLDGQGNVVGVIGSVATPGDARDLAVEGTLAVVLDTRVGLSTYDISDPQAPVRLAQVSLTQTENVALSGGLGLVGHLNGAALFDFRAPATPFLLTNFSGPVVPTVALASPYGYFGQGNQVRVLNLVTAALLPSVEFPAVVDDLAVEGDLLFVLTRTELHVLRRTGAALTPLSQVAIAGGPAPLEKGRRLFAGGGRAYVGYFQGFTVLDVANPEQPVILAQQATTQAAIHDLAENGSGVLAAVTSFGGTGSLGFSLYDVRSGTTTTDFLTTIATPGDPFAVVLHRGLAYVADGPGGLQVIRYLAEDRARQLPRIGFGPPLSTDRTLELGSTPLLTFSTGDDVQVRDVVLFVDDLPVATAGTFPFQIPVAVNAPSDGRTNFVLRARATDTGGNERWTEDWVVNLTPDRTSPIVRVIRPAPGAQVTPDSLESIVVASSEALSAASFGAGFQLQWSGSDGVWNTADDTAVPLVTVVDPFRLTVSLRPESGFRSGLYRFRVGMELKDVSGFPVAAEQNLEFRVLFPTVVATSPVNNSSHRPGSPTLSARFSTMMDLLSLRNGGFRLDQAGPDGVSGTADDVPVSVATLSFSATSNRMDFVPAPPLASGRYRARLTTNAQDVLGNRLLSETVWNFTVVSPTVTAVVPPDLHAIPLSALQELYLHFSDPMDPATFASGIDVALTNGTPVAGANTVLDATRQVARLSFTAPLAVGEYRLRVTTNLTDQFGNRLGADVVSRFGIHGPVSWGVDASGRWDVASNWTPARPIPGDDVILDRPAGDFSITNSTGHVLVSALRSAENLVFTGGSLTLKSNSVITGGLLIQNTVLSNRAELRLAGETIVGRSSRVRGGGTLLVQGTAWFQGGTLADGAQIGAQHLVVDTGALIWDAGFVQPDLSSDGVSTWSVRPEGRVEFRTTSSDRDWQNSRGSWFWNQGTVRQLGESTRLRFLNLHVTNDGVWEVLAGRTEVLGGWVQSGRLSLSEGTSLRVSDDQAPPVDLAPGAVMEGAGAISFRRTPTRLAGRFAITGGALFESLAVEITGTLEPGAGSLTFFNSEAVVDTGPLVLSSPVILQGGTLEFRKSATLDDLRWEYGRVVPTADVVVRRPLVVGSPTVANGAQLGGPGRLRLEQGLDARGAYLVLETNTVLEHAGNTVWMPRVVNAVTTLEIEAQARLLNLPSGRFEIATNGTISGPGVFENRGLLIKAAHPRTNVLGVLLENHGRLEINGGRMRLIREGVLGGQVAIVEGAVLELGTRQELTAEFSGGGTLQISGGSNVLAGTLQGPQLSMIGGSLQLPPDLVLTNVAVSGSLLRLTGDLRLRGESNLLTGLAGRVEGTGILRNEGRVRDGAVWYDVDVENAGFWEFPNTVRPRTARLFRNLPGGEVTITNVTGSFSPTPSGGVFDNAGVFRKISDGTATLEFAFTNRAVIEARGRLFFNGAFSQTVEGVTRLNGGYLGVSQSTAELRGEIRGPGQFGFSSATSSTFRVNAALRPGGQSGFGVLSLVAGNGVLTGGVLHVRLGGGIPGTEHDQLTNTGRIQLGGQVRLEFVDGFVPSVGEKFLIVSASSVSQTFQAPLVVEGLPAGLAVRLNYLANGVEVEVIAGM